MSSASATCEHAVLLFDDARYDPAAVAGAWGQLLSGADALASESTYLYDLADVGRQVQALCFRLRWSVIYPCNSVSQQHGIAMCVCCTPDVQTLPEAPCCIRSNLVPSRC